MILVQRNMRGLGRRPDEGGGGCCCRLDRGRATRPCCAFTPPPPEASTYLQQQGDRRAYVCGEEGDVAAKRDKRQVTGCLQHWPCQRLLAQRTATAAGLAKVDGCKAAGIRHHLQRCAQLHAAAALRRRGQQQQRSRRRQQRARGQAHSGRQLAGCKVSRRQRPDEQAQRRKAQVLPPPFS